MSEQPRPNADYGEREWFYDIVGRPTEGPNEQWMQETFDWLEIQRQEKLELDRLRAENKRLLNELDSHRNALAIIRDMPPDAPQALARCKGYARATLKKWAGDNKKDTL